MSTIANVQSRTAGLAPDSSHTISGVAIGVGDVTRGLSGDLKVWQAEQLREAAATLEGTPINPLHSQAEVGEVVRAGFDADRGIVYEAELNDESLAEQAANGQLEVSIEARHADGGTVETDRGEAMLATDIQFTGMAMVQHGAAPSATASPGEAAALSPADIRAALESDNPASTEGDAEDIEIDDSTETALENKVVEHNDDAPESKQVTLSTLKKVYRRGAGAWLNSNAGATQNQWAMARVNAFLEDLMDDRPLNEGNDNDLAPDDYSPAEAAATLADVNGTEVDLSPPEPVVNAAEAALDAKGEYDTLSDCGTGVGEDRAETIVNGDLTAEDFTTGGDHETAIPDYLNSHSEDVEGIDEPPTQWSEETWTDGCGPVQYALWGGTATGTGLDWAQSTAEDVEAAMEDAENAKHRDEDADMAEVPDKYIFENPNQAVAKAEEMGIDDGDIHQHGEGEDAVFMPAASHDALMDMLDEMDELAEAELKGVGPVEFEDTANGDLDESEIPSEGFEPHYLNAGDTKSASSFPLVDADGTLRRGNVEAAWNLRGQGDLGMPRDAAERVLRSLAEEFGEPGSEANPLPEDAYEDAEAASGTDESVNPERGSDEVSAGGEPDGRSDTETTDSNSHMSDDNEDLEAKVEELRARLSEKDDEIAELKQTVEQYDEERADVARAYAEALAAGDTVFDEDDLVEKFEVAELREKYEKTDTATLADVEPDVQSGDADDQEEATLSADASERIAAIETKLSHAGAALPDSRVSELREEAADLAGTDSYEAALEAI